MTRMLSDESMLSESRRAVALSLAAELMRIVTMERRPVNEVVQRHAKILLTSLGDQGAQFALAHIALSELETIDTVEALAGLLVARLAHDSEIDEGGWTAF